MDRRPADLDAELTELERVRSTDIDARLERAAELEAVAAAAGDERSRQRARLVIADMLPRRGDLAGGAAGVGEVRAWAEANGDQRVLARCHLVLSSLFSGIGDLASSLDNAVRALELLPDGMSGRVRGPYLTALANALAADGSVDEARRRYREAETTYLADGDTVRALDVLNNLVVLEYEHGDPSAARHAERLLVAVTDAGLLDADFADTIARARLAAGDLDGAAALAAAGIGLLDRRGDGNVTTPAELHLTLAEIELARGRLAAAAEALARCEQVCVDRELHGIGLQAKRVRADAHAAAGEFGLAYEAHRRFHDEWVRTRHRQEADAARTRHALLAAAEARRDAERFHRQARTDALTGLHNRRHVDETLPRLLDDPAGVPLAAAIVDVDHFKRVNDRFTHAVGDRVLSVLARYLEDVALAAPGRPGLAARLGGEEFVVACTIAGDAAAPFERLRRAVAGHDWDAVAPGLRVTISIGVAVARPDDSQHSLLARADACLYAAKSGGRNRVVVEGPDQSNEAR